MEEKKKIVIICIWYNLEKLVKLIDKFSNVSVYNININIRFISKHKKNLEHKNYILITFRIALKYIIYQE